MGQEKDFQISITVAQRVLKFRIPRGDQEEEEIYRVAGQYLESRFSKFVKDFPQQDIQDHISLAAFSIAVELIRMQRTKAKDEECISEMDKELSEILKR